MKEYSAGKFRAYDPPDGERRHRYPMPVKKENNGDIRKLDDFGSLKLFSDNDVAEIELPELRRIIRGLNITYLEDEGIEGTVGS